MRLGADQQRLHRGLACPGPRAELPAAGGCDAPVTAGLRRGGHTGPAYRRHRDEIDRLEQSLDYIDLALRNSRVFARRLTSAINHAALSDEATENIAEVLQETAAAIDELSLGLAEMHEGARRAHLRTSRLELAEIAGRLHPRLLDVQRLEGETVVMLFRPLMVDLLEATGMDSKEARDILPPL
jgi:hypothetical protein